MCEFEPKLIAWIDGELDENTTLEMQRHVQVCNVCSDKAAEFREVSKAFAAFCTATPIQRNRSRLRWMATTAAVLAAAAALILWMLPRPAGQLPLTPPKPAAPPAIAFQTFPASLPEPVRTIHHHNRVSARAEIPPPAVWTSEPSIEIAIPGDAMFAPGAVPAGFSFAADMSLAGDGSPRALRVHPGVYLK